MADQAHEKNTGWDKKAAATAMVSGNVSGACFFACVYPPVAQALGGQSHLALFADWGMGILLGSLLLLPALLSALGRRLYFLWGVAPLIFLYIWVAGEGILERDPHEKMVDYLYFLLLFLICWVISSSPVSLIRLAHDRQRTAERQALAALEAYQAAAAIPQEGVWPPPPQNKA